MKQIDRLAPYILLVIACGPSSSDDATEGGSTSATTTSSTGAESSSASATTTATGTGTGDAGCNEVPPDAATLAECGLPEPCGAVFTYDEFAGGCLGPLEIDDSPYNADETCVLEALAAGQPAVIHLEGSCTDIVVDRFVYVLGDGIAMTTSVSGGPCFGCGCDDWSEDWAAVRRCNLADPSYFEACLAEADPMARVACMTIQSWFVECSESAASCTP